MTTHYHTNKEDIHAAQEAAENLKWNYTNTTNTAETSGQKSKGNTRVTAAPSLATWGSLQKWGNSKRIPV